MKLKVYQLDAFSDKLFSGNPAGVCPLDEWIPEELMQNIAMENNLAETAFFVKKNERYEIRWFTPAVEVDLCGHATLASAFILFNVEGFKGEEIEFYSERSGRLTVTRNDKNIILNFPADIINRMELTSSFNSCFDVAPIEAYSGKTDYMFVFENEDQIRNLKPNIDRIAMLKARGAIVTASGKEVDFVSRFFAPQSGINEDPATGSAHTTLTPYWHRKTGKKEFTAVQLSARRGYFQCTYLGDRISISGQVRLFFKGEIEIPES
jgi:PhzF family phenazine biosynthesis protein